MIIRKSTILLCIFILLGFMFLAGCSVGTKELSSEIVAKESLQKFETKSTGSTGMGDVLIELTPRGVIDGKLEMDIALNTHSVLLSNFNLKEITTLEYGEKSLKPIEAPTPNGHHVFGKLIFDVGENIESYSVSIVGIPQVEKRTFTWGIE